MSLNETKEQRFKRINEIKTWGFDAGKDEREELGRLVLKSGLTRKKAVLKALRETFNDQGDQ